MFNHVICALKGFFSRLEHELDSAIQIGLVFFQQSGSGQKHGSMEIVATGMGFRAGGTGKIQSAFLCHGQGIHIGPEQDAFSGLSDNSRHTVSTGLCRDSQFLQFCQHISLAPGHIQTHFRIGVEPASVGNGFLLQCQGSFVIIHSHSSRSCAFPE